MHRRPSAPSTTVLLAATLAAARPSTTGLLAATLAAARPSPAALLAATLTAARPSPAAPQTLAEATATPDSTATLFLRSVRAIRWDATARLLHPETLARFHYVVTAVAEADTTGELVRALTGTDADGYPALDAATVFERSVGTVIDGMPGLMNALFDRDDVVLGHVAEGAERAHVLYRTLERLSGATPEVRVVQLARAPEGWRVLWSEELEVLDAALRGAPRSVLGGPRRRNRPPGNGAGPGSRQPEGSRRGRSPPPLRFTRSAAPARDPRAPPAAPGARSRGRRRRPA